MNTKYLLMTAASGLLLLGSCVDESSDWPDGQDIMLTLPTVESVGTFGAELSSVAKICNHRPYTKAGYVVSEAPNPTIYNNVYEATVRNDSLLVTLDDLRPMTQYYVRAFMNEYKGKTVYSEEIVLTTNEGTPEEMLKAYRGPKYDDYYVNVAGWADRSKWNLANVHDPSVVLASDGYYYMYQTDASYGNTHVAGGHFHGRRSKDLVNWEYLGGTMQEAPAWVAEKYNEIRKEMGLEAVDVDTDAYGYWAPDVVKVNDNLYRMYYSIVVPGHLDGDNSWSSPAFIGLMENDNPANNDGWVDKGYVITNSSDRGLNFNVSPTDWGNCYYKFNAIDPSVIITPGGEHYLIYGSWHSGIAAVKLDATSGKPSLGKNFGTAADIASYGKLVYTRQMGNRWQASEGPEIVYRNGYYYIFLAYDELSVAYNTRVVRSKNIEGPYVDINGMDCTNSGGDAMPVVTHPYKFNNSPGWVGFSHCTVFDDGNDNWFYSSQARFPADYDGNEASNAVMLGHVRSIVWTEDGWPLVMPERYGAVPQVAVAENELVGDWEFINLAYQYGIMQESSVITLFDNHVVQGGPFDGRNWSYDAAKQILKIDDVSLYVKRECDWEANNRPATLVFAGYGNNTTFWGKKS